MYAKFAPLALSLLFVNAVAAAAAAGPSSSPILGLSVRAKDSEVDTSEIPDACKSTCDASINTLTKCEDSKDDKCLCNGAFSDALVSCFNCVIRTNKDQEMVEVAQKEYDTVKETCADAGGNFADHKFTIAGDNGAGRLAGPVFFGVGAAVLAGLL